MARVILDLTYDLGDDFEDDAPTDPEAWKEYLQGEPIEPRHVRIERVRVESPLVPLEARITLRETDFGLAVGVDYNRESRPGDAEGAVYRVLKPMLDLFQHTAETFRDETRAIDAAAECHDGRRGETP